MAISKITTNSITDDAVTTAKVNPAQTDITSVGTLTSFASTGIDDNADATAMTIDSSELVGIGTSTPSSYNSYGNGLVIKKTSVGANHAGMSLISATSGYGSIHFADGTGNTTVGAIEYSHSANSMSFATGGATGLTIDGNGYVTKPSQPRMSNYKYSSQSIPHNTLTPIQYNGTNWTNNIQGITSSNTHSRYTVPVSGWYFLHATLYWGNVVVTGSMITVHVNGSYMAYTYNQSMPVYTMLQVTHGLYLQANDYFEFMGYQHNGSNLSTVSDPNGDGSMFATAYLLG